MKAFTAIALIGAVVLSTGLYHVLNSSEDHSIPAEVRAAWVNWKMTHGRSYGVSSEETFRLNAFHESYKRVTKVNSNPKSTWTAKLGKFADLTKEEFRKTYLGMTNQPTQKRTTVEHKAIEGLRLSEVDWAADGKITAVKDQGQCGSCWAFSTIGALEGHHAINEGYSLVFSEQTLVDCATWETYLCRGCNGGLMSHGFEYTRDHGVYLLADYPYTAEDGTCKAGTSDMVGKTNLKPNRGGYMSVGSTSADHQSALAQQPISVGVEADAWQDYNGGIYSDPEDCGVKRNHGVTLVGWGTENGQAFWKIKNSWGAGWGESGYIKLAILDDTQNPDGMCGILGDSNIPVA